MKNNIRLHTKLECEERRLMMFWISKSEIWTLTLSPGVGIKFHTVYEKKSYSYTHLDRSTKWMSMFDSQLDTQITEMLCMLYEIWAICAIVTFAQPPPVWTQQTSAASFVIRNWSLETIETLHLSHFIIHTKAALCMCCWMLKSLIFIAETRFHESVKRWTRPTEDFSPS